MLITHFMGHTNAVRLYNELENPSAKSFSRVAVKAYIGAASILV